uniref:Uncharacterized protein n=1 Tax=uncultured marine thaumarchaeote KM3_57_D03 TaxID=1456206 RepID=A0A075H9W2_9ARCH|nr:hypothetical protein [uncultured marine thaumarchaeote KM3_57_D03]
MLEKDELSQILAFVAKRWTDLSRDPDNKAVKTLPDTFWMNSIGGPAGKGRWVTTLMYTENEDEANRFKDVLLRWQSMQQQQQQSKSPDLVQIKGTEEKSENKN